MANKSIKPYSKDKNLSIKQRKWVRAYLRTGNSSKAAMLAYGCKKENAASIGYQNTIRLHSPVVALMEAKNLSLGRLLDVMDEGLDAEKTTKDGETEKDYAVRHKYMSTAAKWLGVDEKKAPEVVSRNTSTNYNFFDFSADERDAFNKKYVKKLREQ